MTAALDPIALSVRSGQGIDLLLRRLTERAAVILADRGTVPPTRERHRVALTRCVSALDAALFIQDAELVAEELRIAADELGRVTGRIDIEEMLDLIFREFCIGK